jgi:endonuclease V-like protein UPF0215 family
MRKDWVIDGVVLGKATREGLDATDVILSMYQALDRTDINFVMLDGLIISMYNIIEPARIVSSARIPVVAVTFRPSKGLEKIIRDRFPDSDRRLEIYHTLGVRDKITLDTGKQVYIRYWGLDLKQAQKVTNRFNLQGALPEPIRVAKLVARSYSHALK